MKKITACILAVILTVTMLVSCSKGTSIAIGAVRIDNQPKNLFKFLELNAYTETVEFLDKTGNVIYTEEYYYERSNDVYSFYNIEETVGGYHLYAYEGNIYTKDANGFSVILPIGITYQDFANLYLDGTFPLDGELLTQRNSKTLDDGRIVAEYETKLTPQQAIRVASFGITEDDTVVTKYTVNGKIVESVEYFIENGESSYPFAKRSFTLSKEKEDRFSVLDKIPKETVSVDFVFSDTESKGRHFDIPKGITVGMESGDLLYEYYYDREHTKPYSYKDGVVTENLTLYVVKK